MTNRILPVLLILACAWGSCKNDAPQSGTAPETSATETAPSALPGTGAAPGGDALAAPSTALPSSQPAAAPGATGAAGAATAASGANPPHGQPGHRCDIAVGAPLNSPPNAGKTATTAQPATATPAAQPSATPISVPAPGGAAPAGKTTAVAPGSNPPHGQPGHRCDIAVGAPLDSKPKQ